MDPGKARKKSNAHKHAKKIRREEGGGKYIDTAIERLYDQGITVNRRNRNLYRFKHPESKQKMTTASFSAGPRLFNTLDDVSGYLEGPRTQSNVRRNYSAVEDIFRKKRKRYPKTPKRDRSKAQKKSNIDKHKRSINREEGLGGIDRGIERLYDEGIVANRRNRNDYRFKHPDSRETIVSRSFTGGLYLFDSLEDACDILESPKSKGDVQENYGAAEDIMQTRRNRA